jgi:hypothetical protein
MRESKAIFVNEEAARLLNYFISYKEIISKNESNSAGNLINDVVTVEAIAEPEHIILK